MGLSSALGPGIQGDESRKKRKKKKGKKENLFLIICCLSYVQLNKYAAIKSKEHILQMPQTSLYYIYFLVSVVLKKTSCSLWFPSEWELGYLKSC